MRLAITAVLAIAVVACAACGDSESDQERLTELQNSLIQLRDGYQEALAPIDCG